MAETVSSNFIYNIIDEDRKSGKHPEGVHTRFPPEPNGYLHFGTAEKYAGLCNLRFDDTNPTKEDTEYVDSIQEDIRWLGFSWGDRRYYASDYFEKLYEYARALIEKGLAYVDDLTAEEIRAYRGTLTEPGRESPCRSRSVEENLDIFARMKAGEFPDGSHVLRAKIPSSTASRTPCITARAMPGASTRCTISRILCRTPSRRSRIPCARWSSRITGPSTIGSWKPWTSTRTRARGRSSSRVSMSRT